MRNLAPVSSFTKKRIRLSLSFKCCELCKIHSYHFPHSEAQSRTTDASQIRKQFRVNTNKPFNIHRNIQNLHVFSILCINRFCSCNCATAIQIFPKQMQNLSPDTIFTFFENLRFSSVKRFSRGLNVLILAFI